MNRKIKTALVSLAVAATSSVVPLATAQPAQATWAPGWNNLWVRAACTAHFGGYAADNVTGFSVWVPGSPQGDKYFAVPQTGLGLSTAYYHYDNVNKTVWGSTYLNYRVNCRMTGTRSGQIRWGGNAGSTSWVDIRA